MSKRYSNEPIELELMLHRETQEGQRNYGALLVSLTETTPMVWLPKSQIVFDEYKPERVRVTLPEWLAMREGLI
jgi:hypothetical protein